MRSALKKIGNSSGLIIPTPLLAKTGAKAGDAVGFEVPMSLFDCRSAGRAAGR